MGQIATFREKKERCVRTCVRGEGWVGEGVGRRPPNEGETVLRGKMTYEQKGKVTITHQVVEEKTPTMSPKYSNRLE